MQRKNFSSGTRWEPIVGYSRAVKVGDFVFVSGTTATNKEGNIVGLGNPYLQTIQIIKNIQTALQIVGSCLEDVVRTRIYVTDINNWEKVGQAHAEYFNQIRLAVTLIEEATNQSRNPSRDGGGCRIELIYRVEMSKLSFSISNLNMMYHHILYPISNANSSHFQ
ncbi:MAG TPA: RidA family protein [Nitrososphaeraceae archaeon]|jgi:enamine deaminase RidA (YjgF/YER057c/UK114 family)